MSIIDCRSGPAGSISRAAVREFRLLVRDAEHGGGGADEAWCEAVNSLPDPNNTDTWEGIYAMIADRIEAGIASRRQREPVCLLEKISETLSKRPHLPFFGISGIGPEVLPSNIWMTSRGYSEQGATKRRTHTNRP